MTYPCFDIVYGIRYTKEMQAALEARGSMYDELEDYGFEFLYDAGGSVDIAKEKGGATDAIGFLGTVIEGGAYWDLKLLRPQITGDMRREYDAKLDKMPVWLQDLCPSPDIIVVWSDS